MLSDIQRPVSASVVKSIWRSVLVGNGEPPVVLPEFDYLVLLGSSTTFQAFTLNSILGRQEHPARKAMTAAGYNVPIISKAVEGESIATLDANINTYLTSLGPISAADKSRVAVVVNIGSNDIGATAYADMPPATKAAMLVGLNSIVDKITAFGFTPIMATVHSRKGFAEMYEGWADSMYRPLISTRTPFWYVGPLAVFDYCRLYLDNKDVTNWWNPDNVHPWMATVPMQQYTAARLASKSQLPPVAATERVLIYLPNALNYFGGMNSIAGGATGSSSSIYNTKGQLISGATFGWTGATGISGSFRTNPGAWGVDLANNLVQGCTTVATGTITFTAAFGAAFANRTGKLRFTGSSSTAGRLTNVVVGGSNAILNASGPGVQIVEVPFTMDAAGTLIFTAAPKSPSTYANVSGVELIFN